MNVPSVKIKALNRSFSKTIILIVSLLGISLLMLSGNTIKAAACTSTLSNGSGLNSAFAAALPGSTICLNAGDYGSFTGGQKSNNVTIKAAPNVDREDVSFGFNFNPASNITIDGVTINSGHMADQNLLDGNNQPLPRLLKNIIIKNSKIIAQIHVRGDNIRQANIVFDSNLFTVWDPSDCIFDTPACNEAFLWITGPPEHISGAPASGVTVQNNEFTGFLGDGVNVGAKGVQVIGNVFHDMYPGTSEGVHADAIQLYGSTETHIRGNYFYNLPDGDPAVQATDSADHELIEDNVIASSVSCDWFISMFSDNGSIIRHNTLASTDLNGCDHRARISMGAKTCGGRPPTECDAGVGTIIKDNIIGTIGLGDNAEIEEFSNNLVRDLDDLTFIDGYENNTEGTPTFVGGNTPTTWAGFALAENSLGENAASDDTDMGSRLFASPVDPLDDIVDEQAPSTPSGVSANSSAINQVNLSWTASTDDFAVAGYKVYRGGTQIGTSQTNSYVDATVSAGTSYSYTVKAYDVAENLSAASSADNVTTPETSTFWSNATQPAVNTTDGGAIELGMKFKSSTEGSVQAIRFYKAANNTGTHIGHLWTANGTELAEVTFSGETSTGWQEAALSNPVNIEANTVYVVSYYAPNGNYSADSSYFAQDYANAPLTAPYGNNGVYIYASGGGFPTNTFNDTNYWVDIRISPDVIAPDSEAPSVPSNVSANAAHTQAGISWNASTDNVGVTGYKVLRNGTQIGTTATTSYTDTSVIAGVSYSYTVKAYDALDNTSAASSAANAAIPTSATLWSNSAEPANPNVADNAVEVGTKFQTTVAGSVTAIRFYKGANNTGTHIGHLWTAGGTQLAEVTFSGETSSGWQEAALSSPVSLDANTTYVVSYHAPNGNYAASSNYFANEYLAPPLKASANSNGVYGYGSSGTFPSNSFNSTNYWVDVRFSVPDVTAPTTSVTAPANNASNLYGTVNVTADASDNIGVSKVEFYVDNTLVNTDTSSPYGFSWDTAPLSNGSHTVVSKAYDAANNITTSSTVSVTTANDLVAPSVPSGLAAVAQNTTSVKLTWNASTDNVGVTGYKVYRGGTQIADLNALTYTDTGLTSGTSYNYTVAAYDAKANLSDQTSAVAGRAAYTIGVETIATTKQTTASENTISPTFSTTGTNQLLVAFVAADGSPDYPEAPQNFFEVTGGGLTWTMQRRVNTQHGVSEIWTAVAPSALTNVQVNAKKDYEGYLGYISVVAFTNADTTIGAVAGGNGSTGAATASLTTTRGGSWVWGVGNDWDNATARTVLSGQDKVDEYLASVGDTFWLQRLTSASTLGDNVTLGTSAPTADRWNFAAIEILPKP